MEKKEKDKLKKPEKIKYLVEIEALVPIMLQFKIEAENPQEALKKIYRAPDSISVPNFSKQKRVKAIVKKQGSNMILVTKKL